MITRRWSDCKNSYNPFEDVRYWVSVKTRQGAHRLERLIVHTVRTFEEQTEAEES